ncbi:MAG: alpha/beta fold hydrolase [Bacteroidales bacterium]
MTTSRKSTIKMGMKAMILFVLLPLAGFIISLFVYLIIVSPGKPATFLDENGNLLEGSISEKIFVTIGGVEQGMIIRSKNIDNPVLLYLHGGPGFPIYHLIEKYNPGLEDFFTVCYWEQRGGGLSYTSAVTVESMHIDQLASDAIEVTNYLRERFGQEKIYILGHSGGTTIGLPLVARAPELFHAYIAMAQLTRQSESEKIAWDFMLKKYNEINDKRSVKQMEKYRVHESDADLLAFYNSGFRDEAMHQLGIGTMKEMRSIIKGIFLPSWTCKAYTLREKLNLWQSKFSFLPKTNLRSETLWTDFAATYPSLDIPVFFMCGRYDLTVNVDLTRDYYEQLNAPVKAFFIFEKSAHSPLFEEPEKFREILDKEILRQDRVSVR